MPEKISRKLNELTALFPSDTAGRDMVSDIPVFHPEANVQKVHTHLMRHAKEYQTLNYIYVVDDDSKILGVTSIRELLQASKTKRLKQIMTTDIVAVNPLETLPRVALLALSNNLKMIPIVDHKNRLVGAFSSNQLLDILNKEFSNDLLRLSGIRVPRKHFHFESMKVVASRLPWMFIGMVGGLITGSIIGAFKSSIQTIVLLAVFIPVIMSTGATSANQAAMVFLRNLIHGDIRSAGIYLLNEIKISTTIGAILGISLFLILSFYPGDTILAGAVSLSLFITIIAGSIVGVTIPMILNKLKLDPSIGAGPFLTIVKDIIAMIIYFTIATAFLSYFG